MQLVKFSVLNLKGDMTVFKKEKKNPNTPGIATVQEHQKLSWD